MSLLVNILSLIISYHGRYILVIYETGNRNVIYNDVYTRLQRRFSYAMLNHFNLFNCETQQQMCRIDTKHVMIKDKREKPL